MGFIRDLFERAREGKPITVGFLGGSITQGCVASEDSLGYAHLVYQWFVKTFPKSNITYVNAMFIGSVISSFGKRANIVAKKPFWKYSIFSQ